MAQEIPLRGGHEYDLLTRARRYYSNRPGKAKSAKNGYRRRVRRVHRQELRSAAVEKDEVEFTDGKGETVAVVTGP